MTTLAIPAPSLPPATSARRGLLWRHGLGLVCVLHLAMSGWFAFMKFDGDEFAFVPDSYLILGGDYTAAYLKEGDLVSAFDVALRSYGFFWKYRPLNSPLIDEADKTRFAKEEARFGYVKPAALKPGQHDSLGNYKKRLIVPEPDRFYHHGAGKPLLNALASIPQLALVKLATPQGRTLLDYQFHENYHPLFALSRLVQIAAGLATVLLTFVFARRLYGEPRALVAAAIVGLFPLAIRYFPNLHHDALLAPFVLATAGLFSMKRYGWAGVCFGFALAAKNTAVFLLPALLMATASGAWSAWRSHTLANAASSLRQQWRGLMVVSVLGLAVLTPFAHPVSYVQEILTPLTNRAYDTRGENVAGFTLSGQYRNAGNAHDQPVSTRPEVTLVHRLVRMETIDFFFVALAALALLGRTQTPLARVSAWMLLVALPVHALVFGHGLTYRYLMFLPFFAIACVDRIAWPRLQLLLGVLLAIDILYCVDPITVDHSHKIRAASSHSAFTPAPTETSP